jgi:hypothetical protein
MTVSTIGRGVNTLGLRTALRLARALGVLDDGARGQQLEAGLPQVVGGSAPGVETTIGLIPDCER